MASSLRTDLQADNDAGSTPCAGFDLQLSSKLLDPRTHISHAKAGGLFETILSDPGAIVCDLKSQVRGSPTQGGGNDSWSGMANSVAHRFLTDSNKLVLNLRRYALFRDIFRLQLATQDTGHVGTFNELLNGFDQPSWLNARPQAEHRASCFRQSKSRQFVCSLNVGQALSLRGGSLRRI